MRLIRSKRYCTYTIFVKSNMPNFIPIACCVFSRTDIINVQIQQYFEVEIFYLDIIHANEKLRIRCVLTKLDVFSIVVRVF